MFLCGGCLHPDDSWAREKLRENMGTSEGPCEGCGETKVCVDADRSRKIELIPLSRRAPPELQFPVYKPGDPPGVYTLSPEQAESFTRRVIEQAKAARKNVPWPDRQLAWAVEAARERWGAGWVHLSAEQRRGAVALYALTTITADPLAADGSPVANSRALAKRVLSLSDEEL